MKKIYIYTSLTIIIVSSILIYFYQKYFGLTIDAYETALNSFIVSLAILVVTVIVINLLFSHHHTKINEKKELNDYIEVLKEPHDSLVFQLKTYIITFVTKEMAMSSPDGNNELKHNIELTDLKDQLDQYITSDFFTKGIIVTKAGEVNLFDFSDIHLNHAEWVMDNSNKILANIHKYLMLYSKLMPNNILKLLVEIELIITRKSVFMIPDIKSFQNEMNKSILDDQSLNEIKKQIAQMINNIIQFETSLKND